MSWKGYFSKALNFLFPRTCVVCRRDVSERAAFAVCDSCWDDIPRWDGLICEICGLPLPDGGSRCFHCRRYARAFRFCRSAALYEGVVRTCLKLLKYNGREFLAKPLGRLMAERFAEWPELQRIEGVVPVPLHFWRKHGRGYNQSELLAKSFCASTGISLAEGVLKRLRATRTQTELKREDRFLNVENAFAVRRADAVRGRSLLVVDDVCTTGATLEACARALKTAGARQVCALTVARQI